MRNAAWGFPGSPYANPFRIEDEGQRNNVIVNYEVWLWRQPDLARRARAELRGRRLGCWCKPAVCHGDVLARVADMREEDFEDWLSMPPERMAPVQLSLF